MVGQGEPLANQTVEEITRVAKVEIAQAARLARETDKVAEKRHRGWQDDSRAFKDEVEDGAASVRGGHHPKFNWQHLADGDRLRDRSQTLHEEISRIEWQGEHVYHMPAHNALASLGRSDQTNTSKSSDKKRKSDNSITNVEWLRRYKEYRPRLEEFEGFLDMICIFQPQGKHKTRIATDFKTL
jgi:hypothetical protein